MKSIVLLNINPVPVSHPIGYYIQVQQSFHKARLHQLKLDITLRLQFCNQLQLNISTYLLDEDAIKWISSVSSLPQKALASSQKGMLIQRCHNWVFTFHLHQHEMQSQSRHARRPSISGDLFTFSISCVDVLHVLTLYGCGAFGLPYVHVAGAGYDGMQNN